jgi:hypothetical protein
MVPPTLGGRPGRADTSPYLLILCSPTKHGQYHQLVCLLPVGLQVCTWYHQRYRGSTCRESYRAACTHGHSTLPTSQHSTIIQPLTAAGYSYRPCPHAPACLPACREAIVSGALAVGSCRLAVNVLSRMASRTAHDPCAWAPACPPLAGCSMWHASLGAPLHGVVGVEP